MHIISRETEETVSMVTSGGVKPQHGMWAGALLSSSYIFLNCGVFVLFCLFFTVTI